MTSYPTKYLFIAETQGIKQAAEELNKLSTAAKKVATSDSRLNIAASREISAQAKANRDLYNAENARQRSIAQVSNAENARLRMLAQSSRSQQQYISLQQKQIALNTQQELSIRKIAGAQADLNAKASRSALAQAKLDKFTDSSSDGGWEGIGGYLEKFGSRFRSAFAYTIAFAAVGTIFEGIGASVRTWIDAQVQLNSVIADTSILLSMSATEGARFADTQRALSFATGQQLSEIAPASMMAQRVGQPELAVSAAQWSMVVGPQLQAGETVDDLRALSIQFDLSMEQINNGLLATLQNSGIAADQLFDLSASFGVFAGQLGLSESERDLREIAGLFAALSNITGQTTPTLQNFVRRMADEFYDPNAALRQQLNAAGIRTVSPGPVTTTYDMFGNASRTSEEIRRPFTEIFAEIAAKGPAAIKAFSTAIDNSLGQPTQSQFILVAENWTKVNETIGKVANASSSFADAVQTAEGKTSTGLGQIASAIQNLFSALGDGEGFARAVRTVASAIQNVYDVTRDPDTGRTRLSRDGELDRVLAEGKKRGIENSLEAAYGDNFGNELVQRRLMEILRVAEVPVGLGPSQRQNYVLNSVSQFAGSDFVRRGDVGTVGAQQFVQFTKSNDFSPVEALKAALDDTAMTGGQIAVAFKDMLTEAQVVSLVFGEMPPSIDLVKRGMDILGMALPLAMGPAINLRDAWVEAANAGRDVSTEMGPLASSASFAENQIINLAGAAAGAAGTLSAFTGMPTFSLPEGYSLADFQGYYERAKRMVGAFEASSGVTYSAAQKRDVAIVNDLGAPIGALNQNPEISELALSLMQNDKTANDKMLSEQKAYQSKALSAQEAYQNKMLGAWNSMVSDLLQPSAVTGTDLFYNSPRGTYNDNWDEPVRRMKADINNSIAGKPLEYGYGGLSQYMNMDAVAMAMGATQEVKEAVLRSEEARVSEQFYNMELPWEAYSGNTDAIIANAQAWIGRKQQKNANMANVQRLLVDAGLGPDAEAFVKAMEEPPILRAMFGGRSADEINTTVTEAVTPDMTNALAKQAANTSWSVTIATAIQNDVTNNYEVIVAAGKVIGEGLAKGSASQFAAAIIPLVLAAISGRD